MSVDYYLYKKKKYKRLVTKNVTTTSDCVYYYDYYRNTMLSDSEPYRSFGFGCTFCLIYMILLNISLFYTA